MTGKDGGTYSRNPVLRFFWDHPGPGHRVGSGTGLGPAPEPGNADGQPLPGHDPHARPPTMQAKASSSRMEPRSRIPAGWRSRTVLTRGSSESGVGENNLELFIILGFILNRMAGVRIMVPKPGLNFNGVAPSPRSRCIPGNGWHRDARCCASMPPRSRRSCSKPAARSWPASTRANRTLGWSGGVGIR